MANPRAPRLYAFSASRGRMATLGEPDTLLGVVMLYFRRRDGPIRRVTKLQKLQAYLPQSLGIPPVGQPSSPLISAAVLALRPNVSTREIHRNNSLPGTNPARQRNDAGKQCQPSNICSLTCHNRELSSHVISVLWGACRPAHAGCCASVRGSAGQRVAGHVDRGGASGRLACGALSNTPSLAIESRQLAALEQPPNWQLSFRQFWDAMEVRAARLVRIGAASG